MLRNGLFNALYQDKITTSLQAILTNFFLDTEARQTCLNEQNKKL